jgi:hypothetical protein
VTTNRSTNVLQGPTSRQDPSALDPPQIERGGVQGPTGRDAMQRASPLPTLIDRPLALPSMGSSKKRERKRVRNMSPSHVLVPRHQDPDRQAGAHDSLKASGLRRCTMTHAPPRSPAHWQNCPQGQCVPTHPIPVGIWAGGGAVPTAPPIPSAIGPAGARANCRHVRDGCATSPHAAAVLSKSHASPQARSAHVAGGTA